MVEAFPRRELGSTGLQVPPLCVGASSLGSMPQAFGFSVSEEQALATVRAVFDGPIPFLDTAASYGDGESERRIGIVIRERGRLPPGFVLTSKLDRDLQTGDFSADQMRRSLARSLRLLGLDRLPLVFLHDPEWTTFEAAMAPGGAVEGLLRCRDDGLCDHVGVAGGPIAMMTRYVETGLFDVVIGHNRYTLLNTAAGGFWDLCTRHGVAALNAAPYAGGLLAAGPDAYPRYVYRPASPEILARARRIAQLCTRHGVPLAAAALQFSLRDRRITSTIVGMSRPELIAETVRLAQYPIPDELWDELAAIPRETRDPEQEGAG